MEMFCKIETLDIEKKVVLIRFPAANQQQFETLLKMSKHLRAAGAKKVLIVKDVVDIVTLSDDELNEMGLKRI